MNADKEKFDAWLELQPRKIKDNITVKVNKDKSKLLHISTNPDIATFTPRMPENVMSQDTNVVPRICVSLDLAGCIVAHGRVHFDVYNNDHEFTIYGLDWEYALEPNEKIAGIGKQSVGSELWLVPYDKAFVYNKPVKYGKATFTALTVVPNAKRDAGYYLNAVIRADHDFNFFDGDKDTELKSGKYYSVRFEPWMCSYPKHNSVSFELSEIDRATYDTLLSTSVKKVPDKLESLKWGK